MNIWHILGIEPTRDIKLIKSAYAEKLKATRPNEKPEEFQQLHQAYKRAQHYARQEQHIDTSTLNQTVVAIDDGVLRESGVNSSDPYTYSDTKVSEENSSEIVNEFEQRKVRLTQEADKLCAIVETKLVDNLALRDKNSWQFLAQSEFIFDSEFNWEMGLWLFRRLAQHEISTRSRHSPFKNNLTVSQRKTFFGKWFSKMSKPVSADVLRYLDSIFGWTKREFYISQSVAQPLYSAFWPCVEASIAGVDPLMGIKGSTNITKKPSIHHYYLAKYPDRFMAMLIDLGLVVLISVIFINGLSFIVTDIKQTTGIFIFIIACIFYFYMVWLFQRSTYQATPGMMVLGLKTYTRGYSQLGSWDALLRTVYYILSCALFFIMYIVNMVLADNFLHDRLSKTYVINYRLSKKETEKKTREKKSTQKNFSWWYLLFILWGVVQLTRFNSHHETQPHPPSYTSRPFAIDSSGVNLTQHNTIESFTKTAEGGNAKAQFDLGFKYEKGFGVKQDYAEAMRWYQKAAEQGHSEAQFNLALLYANGLGVRVDNKKAFEWYTKAAAQGNAGAQCNLGVMYLRGKGTAVNLKKSFEWTSKAAEQGNAIAQFNLGNHYYFAVDLPSSEYKKAFQWWSKSAAQGYGGAQLKLAEAYSKGSGVSRDPVLAYMWYLLAEGQSNKDAKLKERIVKKLTEEQKASAVKLAEEWRPTYNATK